MMKKMLPYLALSACLSIACSGANGQSLDIVPGMGPYVHGQQVIDDLISKSRGQRIEVPSLTNSIVTKPVTVTGTGPLSVVSGNILVNPSHTSDSQVNVQCKYPHGIAIVTGNAFINEGYVTSSSKTASTGQLVIDCGKTAIVNAQGNAYINDGYISGR